MQKLYTAKQIAEILQIHVQTVYRWAYEGKIRSIKVGNARRFILPDGITE